MPQTTRLPILLLLATIFLLVTVHAQSTQSASPTPSGPPSPAPTFIQSSTDWKYYGCFNETTLTNGTRGARALNGGSFEATDSMTIDFCLGYCKSGGWRFAGLEFTRECYCAPLISSLALRLPDSACDLSCMGNSTQSCGGALALSVYETKSARNAAAAQVKLGGSVLALGIAVAGLLYLA